MVELFGHLSAVFVAGTVTGVVLSALQVLRS